MKKTRGLALILNIVIFLTACNQSQGITLEQFEEIDYSKTKAEIVRFLGIEGTYLFSEDLGSIRRRLYMWEGKNGEGMAIFSFNRYNQLIGRSQSGLE